MKRTIIAIVLSLLATSAFAQQQQPSPPETALQINAVIGQWAQAIVQQAKLIEQLQARIKELETKPADK
jgi:TolA-binding protein